MELKFYLDTSIWMDLYEDRKGFNNEPLGDYAWDLVSYIKTIGGKIIVSVFLLKELERYYPLDEIRGMTFLFEGLMIKAEVSDAQIKEAKSLSKERNVPFGDAIHAVVARDNNAIIVSRDRHFMLLADICNVIPPEKII
ncbi:MAG: type II toxin-antitoxin system VapC family toxin [Nanoarchaeota archaeon]|nr:type II toxin-antitoxin system VapC family toxin [Nanoarchaeota archaeon]